MTKTKCVDIRDIRIGDVLRWKSNGTEMVVVGLQQDKKDPAKGRVTFEYDSNDFSRLELGVEELEYFVGEEDKVEEKDMHIIIYSLDGKMPNREYYDYTKKEYEMCSNYDITKKALEFNSKDIISTSIANISFDNFFVNNYRIFLSRNGKAIEIREHMDLACGKDINKCHNLLRLVLGHTFDRELE